MKNILQTSKVIVLAVVLTICVSTVLAWTGPTATPPNGNVAAPINVSSALQTKAGAFWSNTTIGAGQFCLGTSCITSWPTGTGSITYTSNNGIIINNTTHVISADTTYLQRRVTGTCAAGNAIRVINADGTVTCQAVTNGSSYTAGNGINISSGKEITVNTPSIIKTVSGEVGNGGVIPLPSGFTRSQCNAIASMKKINMGGNSYYGEGVSDIFADVSDSGTVTCKYYQENGNGTWVSNYSTCNYLMICTK